MKSYSRTDYVELCRDPDGPALPGSGIEGSCQYDETRQRCFSCNVRSMQVSPSAMPSRRNTLPPTVNPSANAVERGILRDERGVPYRENGKVIGLKRYRDNSRHYDGLIRKAKASEAPASRADREAVTVVKSPTTATSANSD